MSFKNPDKLKKNKNKVKRIILAPKILPKNITDEKLIENNKIENSKKVNNNKGMKRKKK
jgi:hypothetical protein